MIGDERIREVLRQKLEGMEPPEKLAKAALSSVDPAQWNGWKEFSPGCQFNFTLVGTDLGRPTIGDTSKEREDLRVAMIRQVLEAGQSSLDHSPRLFIDCVQPGAKGFATEGLRVVDMVAFMKALPEWSALAASRDPRASSIARHEASLLDQTARELAFADAAVDTGWVTTVLPAAGAMSVPDICARAQSAGYAGVTIRVSMATPELAAQNFLEAFNASGQLPPLSAVAKRALEMGEANKNLMLQPSLGADFIFNYNGENITERACILEILDAHIVAAQQLADKHPVTNQAVVDTRSAAQGDPATLKKAAVEEKGRDR